MTTQQTPAVRVRDLEKSYGDLHVLRGVDFEVAPGSIFALLGSSGAGKTTVVKILSTLLMADAGSAEVNGSMRRHMVRTCATRSASPDSSRPSMKFSAGGRTSCWSPGCVTSTLPA